MKEFTYVPSSLFYWTIKNYQKCEKKLSPSFSFLGLNWRLKFMKFLDGDSEKVQIVLESLSGSKKVQNCEMKCDVQLNANYMQSKKVVLQNKVCCLWNNSLNLASQMTQGQETVVFSVRLTPLRGQFLKEELKRQETVNNITQMQSLIGDIGSLYSNKEHSDFELKCGELSLPVHKAILAARCGYFSALFRSPTKESNENCVEFQDMDPDSLQHVIRYLYTGILPKLPLNSIGKVYKVAGRFLYEPLQMKCISLMINDFTKEENEEDMHPKNQKTENESKDLEDVKEILKELFLTREWNVLKEVCPELVKKMCEPILFGTVKI